MWRGIRGYSGQNWKNKTKQNGRGVILCVNVKIKGWSELLSESRWGRHMASPMLVILWSVCVSLPNWWTRESMLIFLPWRNVHQHVSTDLPDFSRETRNLKKDCVWNFPISEILMTNSIFLKKKNHCEDSSKHVWIAIGPWWPPSGLVAGFWTSLCAPCNRTWFDVTLISSDSYVKHMCVSWLAWLCSKSPGFRDRKTWLPVFGLPLSNCVALGRPRELWAWVYV